MRKGVIVARTKSYELQDRFVAFAEWLESSGRLNEYREKNEGVELELSPLALQIAVREVGDFAKSPEAQEFKSQTAAENLEEKERRLKARLERAAERKRKAEASAARAQAALQKLRSSKSVGGTGDFAESAQQGTEAVTEAPEGDTGGEPSNEDELY